MSFDKIFDLTAAAAAAYFFFYNIVYGIGICDKIRFEIHTCCCVVMMMQYWYLRRTLSDLNKKQWFDLLTSYALTQRLPSTRYLVLTASAAQRTRLLSVIGLVYATATTSCYP